MSFITGGNTIIKESLLAKETTRLLDKAFVIMPWANTTYEGQIKMQGDTVSIQSVPNMAWASATTAGATITLSAFTITKDQLIVDQLATFGTSTSNVEEIQSNLDLRAEIANRLAYGQAELLEKFLVLTAVSGANSSNNLGSYSTALTTSTIYAAVESVKVALDNQNVSSDVALFVSPTIASLVRQSASLFDGFKDGLDVRRTGYLGKIAGLEIYQSNNIGYKKMLAFDKNSVHFAAQWIGFKIETSPTSFSANILGEMAYGAKVCTENAKRIATYAYSN